MVEGELAEDSKYSRITGLIYIFNLIVGTGALTLPAAFHDAGWALSSAVLILLAFMSFLTATFVIETMASANALGRWRRLQRLKRPGGRTGSNSENQYVDKNIQVEVLASDRVVSSPLHRAPVVISPSPISSSPQGYPEQEEMDENHPLIENVEQVLPTTSNYYDITEITEMGKMSSMFFNKTGSTLFYACIAIYLYGDLAIYGAAVSKSIRDVACSYKPGNTSSPLNISENEKCWEWKETSRLDVYRIILAVFTCTIGQFVFCNVSKTKYLQIATSIMRWLAFIVMVVLACMNLTKEESDRPTPQPSIISGVPNLFGVCVYSFMCHHSLPSLITPISRKQNLFRLLLGDYLLILCFYFLLAFTGVFAFREINDLYTLNFQPSMSDNWFMFALHFFLSLFPVFTLSTNFPIIALTLSNNLKSLFLSEHRSHTWFTRTVLFPLLALIPPTCVAMTTNSLEFLVGITGSYAGAGIQYIVPAALVYYARKESRRALGVGVKNNHMSPFKSVYWVLFVQLWAATCIIFVTWNHISAL